MKILELWGFAGITGRLQTPRMARAATLATALLAPLPAIAADPVAPRSGFYFGGHVGYMFGTANATLGDPTGNASGGIASAGGATGYGAFFGGVQAGYEHYFASRLMLGVELDASFPSAQDLSQVLSYRATGTGTANEQLEYLASLRGRAGYAMGSWTPFVTGGIAWASTRYSRTDLTTGNEDANPSNIRLGYVAGAGVDYRLDQRWSARAEYLYTNLGLTGFAFASAPARYDSQYDLHRFRVGLNYKFGETGESKEKEEDRGPFSWELHGQTTFIYQGYPPFNALYSGTNSFPPEGQSRETWTVSAFLGVRLWQGGELYYNPELLQGFGVANTVGAGGYPNGEAQKSNFPYPRYNTSRIFLRQEIGLGGEREKVEGEYGQLSGEKDVSRVTLQVGKFSVKDVFDANDYAQDPRIDFLNWSIWASGAFDYPADKLGLTWGLTAELNRPQLGGACGLFPGRRRAQFQHVRHEPVLARRLCRRAGNALQALRPARRAAAGHLAHQHLRRLLQPSGCARQPRPQRRPHRQRHHRPDPPGPHQIRLLSQPPAGAQRRYRPVRALQLERRAHRDQRLHRHRHQHLARPVDQGHGVEAAGRPHRHRGRAQPDLGRPQRLSRSGRSRPAGGRRRPQLRPGERHRDLLRLPGREGHRGHRRLPVPQQSGLQHRAWPGPLLRRTAVGAIW